VANNPQGKTNAARPVGRKLRRQPNYDQHRKLYTNPRTGHQHEVDVRLRQSFIPRVVTLGSATAMYMELVNRTTADYRLSDNPARRVGLVLGSIHPIADKVWSDLFGIDFDTICRWRRLLIQTRQIFARRTYRGYLYAVTDSVKMLNSDPRRTKDEAPDWVVEAIAEASKRQSEDAENHNLCKNPGPTKSAQMRKRSGPNPQECGKGDSAQMRKRSGGKSAKLRKRSGVNINNRQNTKHKKQKITSRPPNPTETTSPPIFHSTPPLRVSQKQNKKPCYP
jgi:hypothetical protein